MTALLMAAFGVTLTAAVLHGALGLTRPRDRTYLSFACIMAFVAAYLCFEWELYRTTTSEAAVEAMRRQLIAADGFLAGILVFVPAYTRARLPRWLMAVYWGGLALLFVVNLAAPYGIWFSAEPELVRSTFRGEPYTVAVAPPLTAVQYLHAFYVVSLFVLTFRCALDMIRRGERRRGTTLAIALVALIVQHGVDIVRDAVGGSWPYMVEFGMVAWGLVMSIQLAIDFRVNQQRLHETLRRAEQHTAELANMVEASLRMRDKLNTPLQTLELGLEMCTASGPEDEQALADLRRAVVQVSQLGRAVERAANPHRSSNASEEQPT